jgi:hypothetical protein
MGLSFHSSASASHSGPIGGSLDIIYITDTRELTIKLVEASAEELRYFSGWFWLRVSFTDWFR